MTDKGPNLNNLEREINRLRRECAVRTPNTIATDIAQSIHIRKKQEGRLASQTGTPIRSRVGLSSFTQGEAVTHHSQYCSRDSIPQRLWYKRRPSECLHILLVASGVISLRLPQK